MQTLPVFNLDLPAFIDDPYPQLARMRAEYPICHVPQLNATLFTRRADIVASEKNVPVFSSHQPDGLMNQLMGINMMRKDGADHTRERKILLPVFIPDTIRTHWRSLFERDVMQRLDSFEEGQTVDLFSEYAMPVSADALKRITGLINSDVKDLDNWSQAMIDGVSNYQADAATQERCVAATQAIDSAIHRRAKELSGSGDTGEDKSMLAALLTAGLDIDSIAANIKLAISGGQNEPRDAIAGTIWALLSQPKQLELVMQGKADWHQAFEEYCRWISPIGMSPRRIAKRHVINNYELQAEERVFFMFSSANRDEGSFDHGDEFDVLRDSSKHIAFGAGPHFCIAAAVSRCLACELALPLLFKRFPGMSLVDAESIRWRGWAFRGLQNLQVRLLGE